MTDASSTSTRSPVAWLLALRTADPMLLLLRASLLTLLVNSNNDPPVFVAVALLCLVALPRPGLVRSPWLWAGLFVAIGARQLATWHTIDDHIVVTTYWCGALALGLTARHPRPVIAASARFLVGALFAFAAGWKLRSGQFLDGTFFRYSLLFDGRFETPARLVGGTTRAALRANVDALHDLDLSGTGREVLLEEGPRNKAVALAFTWWGALIETTVAVVFLVPLRPRMAWIRHASLLAFATTTYVIVPIGGFGTLLLVLGAAQAASERLRTGYYLGGIVLLIWAAIWPSLFG